MFSGLNEIIVIVVIAAAILFLPGLLAKRNRMNTPRNISPVKIILPWQARLGIIMLLVWLGGTAFYFKPWESDFTLFLSIGLGPVFIILGIAWVIHGYKTRH